MVRLYEANRKVLRRLALSCFEYGTCVQFENFQHPIQNLHDQDQCYSVDTKTGFRWSDTRSCYKTELPKSQTTLLIPGCFSSYNSLH